MSDYRMATVILHYGNPDMTARLHDQIITADPGYAEDVFVVDNHAPLPYPKADVRMERNVFWAGALEYCLNDAARKGYSHLWFLNNDILLPPRIPLSIAP